jgi:uncharacterized protein YwgA
MTADQLVLAVISALPKRRVDGKKRLQKLCFFAAIQTGVAKELFRIHNFGPYSVSIDQASEVMSMFGALKADDIPVGPLQIYVRSYSINEEEFSDQKDLGIDLNIISFLDKYSTIELEVASTIAFFNIIEGNNFDLSVNKTREMKPNKTSEGVLLKAKEILSASKII